VVDAGWDAASRDAEPAVDAVVDAYSGAADRSTPPPAPDAASSVPDAGQDPPDPPLGMNDLPELIRRPLPECGREPDASNAYFVSAGVGQDVANCGGPAGPCRSLRKGLQRAVDDGVSLLYLDNTDVFVEVEPLLLPASVLVAGGFGNVNGRWTRLCDSARGKTRLLSSANPILVAEYVGASKLASLSMETRQANAGETLLGLVARGTATKLWLDDVFIVAADGGDGAPGASGVSGAVVDASCVPSDGADGESTGASGEAAAAGSFSAAGYVSADGANGADGVVGHAGTLGAQPMCALCEASCCGDALQSCGEPGAPGCGGAAGGGGGGGGGGGSSVALFAWDAQVFLAGGSLRAGSGGDGAEGGAAGSGVAGVAGRLGAAGAPCPRCQYIDEYSVCQLIDMPMGLGTLGGAGGRGRDGGPGGAGAGGHAYAAYRGGSAKLSVAADAVLEHGLPGASPAGASGQAGPIGP
jgi:hypothetical protein